MATITVRDVSAETYRGLRARAFRNRRSVAAEIRAILDEAVDPPGRLKLGSALVELFRPLGGVDLDVRREESPLSPTRFD